MEVPKESIPGGEIMATSTTPAPIPPFPRDSATQKVRLAEEAWNTRDPVKVAPAYTIDSRRRNRSEFINGRNEVIAFLSRKWAKELDYPLIKELWAFAGNRIAVRSLTSGTTNRITGIAPTAMRTGNSIMMGLWRSDLHPSTTFPFWLQIANTTGLDAVLRNLHV
jgi:hypothetical protein